MHNEDFAGESLFNALGITDWEWLTGPNGISDTAGGLELHPVDMAMFEYLYLHHGLFEGEQVVSKDWVRESSAKHIAFKTGVDLADYGYQWWRFEDASVERYVEINDIFIAFGVGGQFVFVIPHLNMVVTLTAENFDTSAIVPATRMLFDFIIPAAQSK